MHLWIWLNQGQHSNAVQALAAIVFGFVTIFIGVASLVYLSQATKAARAQAAAADAGVLSARAQAIAAVAGMRPVLLPELQINGKGHVSFLLENVGKSVATQISWAVCPLGEAGGPLNAFIRPQEHGLQVLHKRPWSGALSEGAKDTDGFVLESGEMYLLLVNYIDLANNICQTQCQFRRERQARFVLGFAIRTQEERLEIERTLPQPHDPEACGITAW